jgi:predicted transcriptional regulator
MKKDVITINPQTNMSELRRILREKRISGAPVMDGDEMVGIISIEDFIKWLAERENDCPIRDKMSKDVQTLYADEPLTQAVNKFERLGFGRFVVIDRQTKQLLGIITKGNIVEGLLKKLEIDHYKEEDEVYRRRVEHFFEDIFQTGGRRGEPAKGLFKTPGSGSSGSAAGCDCYLRSRDEPGHLYRWR